MLLAMELMLGGSLRAAIKNPEQQQLLRWEARCARVETREGGVLRLLWWLL